MDNMGNNGPDLSQNQNQQQQPEQTQVPPQYNQQVPPQYNQQVPPQYDQQVPPPQFNQTINVQVPPPGYNPKSKIAAGLLGIFLGSFGVHNFYLGYTGKAVAQLLITVLTCGIGACVSSIWGLIEGILVLTGSIAVDGNGVPLQQ